MPNAWFKMSRAAQMHHRHPPQGRLSHRLHRSKVVRQSVYSFFAPCVRQALTTGTPNTQPLRRDECIYLRCLDWELSLCVVDQILAANFF